MPELLDGSPARSHRARAARRYRQSACAGGGGWGRPVAARRSGRAAPRGHLAGAGGRSCSSSWSAGPLPRGYPRRGALRRSRASGFEARVTAQGPERAICVIRPTLVARPGGQPRPDRRASPPAAGPARLPEAIQGVRGGRGAAREADGHRRHPCRRNSRHRPGHRRRNRRAGDECGHPAAAEPVTGPNEGGSPARPWWYLGPVEREPCWRWCWRVRTARPSKRCVTTAVRQPARSRWPSATPSSI
jgi:hypothetical protein